MSTNMTLITSVTVGSGGAASVTLPATGTIPQTYTDLKIVISARTNRSSAVDAIGVYYNGDTTSARYTAKQLTGTGSGTQSTSYNPYNDENMYVSGASATASTFGNSEIYIPNYTGSNQKSASTDSVGENNATLAYSNMGASLYNQTTAITTISFIPITGTTILEGSTFYLYGISNVTSTTKATGGIVSSDGTYNYHMFPYSGTFTPTAAITVDYLVIAGGGGGGAYYGAGGGAGGLRSTVGTTGGGGSLESALSLTVNTAYTVTVGAGGAGGIQGSTKPTQGGNSVFSTITSTGGGLAGGNHSPDRLPGNGGSGGGSRDNNTAGTGTANQGYAGGVGSSLAGGGGGGAGAVGQSISNNNAANGGAGVAITAFANATQTGVNTYYAGGGGNGGDTLSTGGSGGGGGRGSAGTINTGGGGGGGTVNGFAGGSGLVIIRYAI